jgi:transglutaminase-like putative cysteine protease
MEKLDPQYLLPTALIDSDHPTIRDYARECTRSAGEDPVARAIALYLAVRDGIRYDPYSPFHRPEHYRASAILAHGRGFCVGKASLLCALARSCGIPCRVGFATVRNHLATTQLIRLIGTDLFVYHGFNELYVQGRWVKATPAFDASLCRRHRVLPLEFDGRNDSLFQPYNLKNKQFMEYVEFHGTYADIPVAEILAAWEKAYGRERTTRWIAELEKTGGTSWRNFDREDVWQDGPARLLSDVTRKT